MDQYVIPAPGRLVRDPLNQTILPPEGAYKPFSGKGFAKNYWRRRLRDGDIIIAEPPGPAQATSRRSQGKGQEE